MADSIAGAIIPAATSEAFTSPGSTTNTVRPRQCSSNAVQSPSTPAPTITMGEEDVTGRLIDPRRPYCKMAFAYSAAIEAAPASSKRATRAACWFHRAVGKRSPN